MIRDSSWPADLDARAAVDVSRERFRVPAPKRCQRTTIPTGAKRVIRIEGTPQRQPVMTLVQRNRQREIDTVRRALTYTPTSGLGAPSTPEEISEAEGRYEALLVKQAIKAAGGEIR